ncbi:CHASE domain-containing sensor histidine kinase [Hyalangium rubrum]|uniref:histidine kinase n=1 Tax=Hyalangium rubrum TaxID=3103134 RepID=A0ABU5GXM8_9BACT|nr:CHASE domain-containing protein [Hyalangium sp. s54d21]MDY7225951.1 CHASE domain-containing protein [Hyalangium sp. s54d21]
MNVALPSISRRSTLAPFAVLGFCLVLTAASTVLFRATARARDSARFDNLVRMTEERIIGHLDSDVTLLRGAAGFFAASQEVTPEEFHLYVERLDLKRHDPGVQGIGFTRRIPRADKDAWVARIQAGGQPTFRLWPEEPREEYHAIVYLEPRDARNQAALGYDMFTEPTRREAMERAWRSGSPALSGRVILQQEIDPLKQAGFLLYVPVYLGGKVPPTEAERLATLEGFVYSPFRAGDLFNGIFQKEPLPRVAFRVFDGTAARPEHLLYDSMPQAERFDPPAFTTTLAMEVAGRPWTLTFASQARFEQTLLLPWVPAVGVVGVLLSLMAYAVAWFQVSARQRAESDEAERAQLLAREQAAHARAEAQRTYLHELFMQAPALIIILRGPQHVFEFANAAYQEAVGHRELDGKPLQEVVPDISPEFLSVFDDTYRTGEPRFGQEVRVPIAYANEQPEEKYWNLVWQPRRNPQGTVDGVLMFAFEVTEQVRARQEAETSREEARRSAARLQTITDTLPALVAYVDQEERYRFANQAYEPWFGLKPEQILGRKLVEVLGEPGYSQVKDNVHRALAGETIRYESHFTQPDGRKLFIQSNSIPDRDAQGRVRGYVGLILDITERKRAEEAVRNAVRLRDEFLSVASHELKTPLTPLSLKLQSLAREAEAEPDSPFVRKVRSHVEAGRKQIKRLSDLIGDLLDVSRITSGQLKLRSEPVDFAAVARDVVSRLEPEATRVESPLTVEAPESLVGNSDRMRLEQVVENLLTNAIKYGAGKPIHVRLVAQAERVVLTVKDEGIGIAPEHQGRIFERFERAVSERNYGGLGLGLYITRTILESLGGTIRVQSEPGQGALFTAEFPLGPSAP